MKIRNIFLMSLLFASANVCLAATSATTTIDTLSINVGDANTKPWAQISTPIPVFCSFLLTDLTNEGQKQLYATLVTAKINGSSVTLHWTINGAQCPIIAVDI